MGEIWPFYALFFALFLVLLTAVLIGKSLVIPMANRKDKPKSGNLLYCSFCGKSQDEVGKMVAGPTVFICDECIELCVDIVRGSETSLRGLEGAVTPSRVQVALSQGASGFQRAKMILSLALYEQLKRTSKTAGDVSALPGNGHILLIGPIGCGKRLLAQKAASTGGGPFALGSAELLTDLEGQEQAWREIITELVKEANFNIDQFSQAVVYIEGAEAVLGAGRAGPEQELLRQCLIGTTMVFDSNVVSFNGEPIKVAWDTRQTLFILGGAFHGLPDQSGPIAPEEAERLGRAVGLVEARRRAAGLQSVSREALVAHGLDEELVERLPYVAVLRDRRDGEVVEI